MSVCARCGHVLGVGRFCINCGHPVDAPVPPDDASGPWRTDTAERPALLPATEPVPVQPPPLLADASAPRYPLYADEVGTTSTGTHRAVTDRRVRWLPWLLGALALVLVAGVGTWLLLGGDDDPSPSAADPASSATAPDDATDEPEPSTGETGETGGTGGTGEPSGTAGPGEPTDVARSASVSVPATAPPNQDVDGNLVRYEARNMLDGVPATCWRMAGDGSGETLVFELEAPTRLTSVGLVNGYAKTARAGDRDLDWYAGNRRVLAVVWEFGDGTTVSQDLEETRDLQEVEVDVTTETVELTLVTVSAPGTGPSRRDYTALSEVSFVGVRP